MFWKSGKPMAGEGSEKPRRPFVIPDYLGDRVTLSQAEEGRVEAGLKG